MKALRKVVTLLIAAMMVVSLTACTKKPEPSEKTFKDTFVYATGGVPSSMDPANAGDSVTAYVTNNTQYGLYHIGEDGSMVQDGFKELKISDDELTYTFTLVDTGWSDGKPVTASDYVYGVKHALSLLNADCTYQSFIYDWIVNGDKYAGGVAKASEMDDLGVEAPDDHTLVFHLKTPCPYFISLLSISVFYPVRSDFAVDGETAWANDPKVPTSGAFYFTEIDMTDHFTMKKNPYWINADKVVTENLICKVVEDADAQMIQFQSGEIDFASSVNAPQAYKLFGNTDEFLVSGAINYYVRMNAYGANEALHNRDVRRALQIGFDRKVVVDALDCGNVYYPINGFIPDGMPGINGDWNKEHEDYVYTDYEEAKALLAKAGYGDGLTLEYYFNETPTHKTVAEVLVSEYAKIGVTVKLKVADWRSYSQDITNGNFDLSRGAFSADYMDPSIYLDLMLYRRATTHTQGDEHYDDMLAEAALLKGNERLQKLHEAEKYAIVDQCFNIPVMGYGSAVLMRSGATGYASSPQANEFFWYIQVPNK